MKTRLFTLVGTLLAAGLLLVGLDGGTASATFPGLNGKVVFSGLRSDGATGMFVMNADGSDAKQLDDVGGGPVWSPDGTKIAFEGPEGTLWVMSADGSGKRPLGDADRRWGSFWDFYPAWSPDGTKIAFTRRQRDQPGYPADIWVMNADGSHARDVSNYAVANDEAPDWSPDGTKIAFFSDRDQGACPVHIYVMNADGSDQRSPSHDPRFCDEFPSWSPDGTRIAFTRFVGASLIYVMDADGSGQTNLSAGPLRSTRWLPADGRPVWSPDGTRIAFSRGHHIEVMNSDGTGKTNITGGFIFATQPDWQPLPPPRARN